MRPRPQIRFIEGKQIDFNTDLSAVEEGQFLAWYRQVSKNLQLPMDPDDASQYYDYRGYWKDNQNTTPDGKNYHFVDTYKKPGHPTFAEGSKYSAQQGGSNIAGGKWEGKHFIHSKDTDLHASETEQYLDNVNKMEGTDFIPVYEGEDLPMQTVKPKYKNSGSVSAQKAKKILLHGSIRGKLLTEKQKRFFGAAADGRVPYHASGHVRTQYAHSHKAGEDRTGHDTMPDDSEVFKFYTGIPEDDKILKNAHNFIYEPGSDRFEQQEELYAGIDMPGCAAGSLNCNQYISRWYSAPSLRHIINTKMSNAWNKYGVPSNMEQLADYEEDDPLYADNQARRAEAKKHPQNMVKNMGLDSWEYAKSFVKEGTGTVLWDWTKNSVSELETLMETGQVPIGSLILQGNAQEGDYPYIEGPTKVDSDGEIVADEDATEPDQLKEKLRAAHTSTATGYTPEGKTITYDYGSMYVNKFMYGKDDIRQIIVPNEFKDYTFANLTEGSLKYTANIQKEGLEGWKDDPKEKWYVNDINKGTHIAGKLLKEEYGLSNNVMNQLSSRVVGLAAQETNFGNKGDEDVSLLRQAAISGESWLTNAVAKPTAKWLGNTFTTKTDPKEHKSDWEVEMLAYNSLIDTGKDPAEVIGTDEDGKPITTYSNTYAKFRKNLLEPVVEDEVNNPSVGPLAIKNLSGFSKWSLGLTKDKLFGTNVADSQELTYGAEAALVHLTEDYIGLKKKFKHMNLSKRQLVDLATIAYNSKGKAYNEDFVNFYIKGVDSKGNKVNSKLVSDNYLTKVKNFQNKYQHTQAPSHGEYYLEERGDARASELESGIELSGETRATETFEGLDKGGIVKPHKTRNYNKSGNVSTPSPALPDIYQMDKGVFELINYQGGQNKNK